MYTKQSEHCPVTAIFSETSTCKKNHHRQTINLQRTFFLRIIHGLRKMALSKPFITTLCLFMLTPNIMPSNNSLAESPPIQITVSILPQRYFVQKLAGNRAKITIMVLPGSSPATYEPTPNQLRHITCSKIYFSIGVPFENVWIERFSSLNPDMLIVHTEVVNTNKKDPHIWLSPALVKKQIHIMAQALIKVDPVYRETYKKNLARFENDISNLDKRIRAIFSKRGKRKEFLVLHPAWGHFAFAYGLKQISINREGKEPSAKALANLLSYIKEKGFNTIFVQPQLSRKKAETIAREIKGKIIFIDPLSEDWEKNLEKTAIQIYKGLR